MLLLLLLLLLHVLHVLHVLRPPVTVMAHMTTHEVVQRAQLSSPSVATGFRGPSERAHATHPLPPPPQPLPPRRLNVIGARAAAPRPPLYEEKTRSQHPRLWKIYGPSVVVW